MANSSFYTDGCPACEQVERAAEREMEMYRKQIADLTASLAARDADVARLQQALRESAMHLREMDAVVKDALRGGRTE